MAYIKRAISGVLKNRVKTSKCTLILGARQVGKSTLVKFLVSALEQQCGIDSEHDVCYCAYTGKACQVLQKKGNKPVSTLHKLLWEFKPRSDGTFFL